MPQISPLIKTLKKQLKANGHTYLDVAKLLDLSEASVKRLFAEQNFTLQRLEQICHMMGLEISELVQLMEGEQRKIIQLSLEQEQEIASDLLLLMVTACVINGYSYQDLIDQYDIKPTDCIQKLAALDRLKIIELLPNNRIKLLVAANFSWQRNGPIQKFFQEKVEQEFFSTGFDQDHESLIVVNGLLSKASNLEFQKKMQRLAKEFSELAQHDMALPMDNKHGNTVVLAIRRWQYNLFESIRKK
ncbi:helix-turn-helix transcriptional regulator [Dasania sp. GY-MA-18]|uniref:Helix-turn-helix transcriptional regulator n=1 Tax=Dasania phycosphaerae TaxID=2950436 RepID=A0A9J6RKN2_9GAMM|nr:MULTISPECIES: helix-turn-helix transcriptional regulator [Dasania]MCR8922534.1 helix-turn-helix transcriptional regulator [Dasania sp. GY-MA-18]MCZ0864962.1 helix-turn-helix transcriptional regulator [Dasania phycosphaerae]MCZ0868690.1 helix-turn-helix transcriptional regulator [Dasania phycosphaerae]